MSAQGRAQGQSPVAPPWDTTWHEGSFLELRPFRDFSFIFVRNPRAALRSALGYHVSAFQA